MTEAWEEAEAWVAVEEATLPAARCFAGAACDGGGRLWIAGGGDTPCRGANCFRAIEYARPESVAVAAPRGDSAGGSRAGWTVAGQMSEPRCGLTVAADARTSLLYLCGGYSGGAPDSPSRRQQANRTSSPPTATPPYGYACAGLAYQDTVETFDTASGRGSMLPPMSVPRSGAGSGVGADGALYVVGGSADGSAMLSCCERYDPRCGVWQLLPGLPTPRGYLAAAFGFDGLLYAAGGCGVAGLPVAALEAFDTAAGKWRALPSLPRPRANLSLALAFDGG